MNEFFSKSNIVHPSFPDDLRNILKHLPPFQNKQLSIAINTRLEKDRLVKNWVTIVGPKLAEHTMPLYIKDQKITVAVDESRRSGINILRQHFPGLEAVILDDAFQHRYVKPGLSIITTDFHNLYADDFMIPSGTLREFRMGAKGKETMFTPDVSQGDILLAPSHLYHRSPKNKSDSQKTVFVGNVNIE